MPRQALPEADDEDLQTAAIAALELLQQEGSNALEQHLDQHYDILERHSILRELLAQLDQQGPMSEPYAGDVKQQLQQLQQQHAEQLAPALQAQSLLEGALASLQNGSFASLRASLGAARQGKKEQALSPLSLATALKQQFGANHFGLALHQARSRLAAQFRHRPQAWASPQLCLSLADANSFAAVNTCFTVAGELQRDVSANAGVLLKSSQLDTALSLLGVCETRSSNLTNLVANLCDTSVLNPAQRRQLYQLLRHALAQLPLTMWSKDASAQRSVLLDQLHELMISMSQQMTTAISREEMLTQNLKRRLQSRQRNDRDGSDARRQSQEESSDEERDELA